ncbi:Sulfotransferase oxamniquine resistance protein [Fasciolopsis buskii]|uniref:Sulfotransferase oxamniquine resistance protein n=1 Tax=Fasciolopsis buskii TaxID=27845 RepID=A0A8E0RSN4_9TREM|nr:Sulfotransferase oxamniquine resistance protein [Fasciolopsis buski]
MSKEENEPLLVIGAGLGRTGTKSLKEALELLYQKPCYHMDELVNNHWDHAALWSKLFDMIDRDPEVLLPEDLIHKIFDGYSATTDYPACTAYNQLMRIYPEAKVSLAELNFMI